MSHEAPKSSPAIFVSTGKKGKSVHTREYIPPGQILLEFKGNITTKAELPDILRPEDDRYLQIGPAGS